MEGISHRPNGQELAERYIIGMDPFKIEDFWFKCYQVEHNDGPVLFSAMAGIETALWDIVGKACGQPVVNLVGGKIRDKVRAYANGWYSSVDNLARLQKQVDDVLKLGYRAFKFDPFGPGGREITKSELRQACRDGRGGAQSGGAGYRNTPRIPRPVSPSEWRSRRSRRCNLSSRCSARSRSRRATRRARRFVAQAASAFGARVATGEHCYARFGFDDLMDRGGAHVIQPDLVYSGGFMETKKIAAMAEAKYISVAPHNCDGPGRLVASIHLCANIPNFLILE